MKRLIGIAILGGMITGIAACGGHSTCEAYGKSDYTKYEDTGKSYKTIHQAVKQRQFKRWEYID